MPGMPIDLVMLDLDLSDAQGFSAVEEACAAHPGVPVVVVSGRAGMLLTWRGFAGLETSHS